MMKSIAFLLAFASSASAFSGQSTFYGAGGAGQGGACMLPRGFNGVGVTVAMNQAQYEGSCGKCIKLTGQGDGLGGTPVIGPIFATVDNLCPECSFGDIDLGLGGDGRWQTQWDFVDCGMAASAWSQLPGGRRNLRGADDASPDASKPLMLGPGMYVMPDGIKDLDTVKAMFHAGNGTAVAAALSGGN
ncbi:barwin-related endoglucanase [Nannochloropsis oceanica]